MNDSAIRDRLREIRDPDVDQSVVELGLIRDPERDGSTLRLTYTPPNRAHPMLPAIIEQIQRALLELDGVEEARVKLGPYLKPEDIQNRRVLKEVSHVLAVASGKGGVAKSTSAVNIACALAKSGAKVGLLDADIHGPSVPTMLRVETPPQAGAGGPDNVIIPAERRGMKIVSMGYFMQPGQAAILRGPMAAGAVSQFLTQVDWGPLDYLIIDYPPGTGDIQLTLSQQAPLSGAVVVTTPQQVALDDVERAIAMFEKTSVPTLGVCETMSYFVCDKCDKRHDIFGGGGGRLVAREIGVPFLGGVPIDPRVARSGDEGIPLVERHPDTLAAQEYVAIAQNAASQLAIYAVERGSYLEQFTLEWQAMD